ncbi:7093_t:CDS:2, partial [Ambispora leptoticha]
RPKENNKDKEENVEEIELETGLINNEENQPEPVVENQELAEVVSTEVNQTEVSNAEESQLMVAAEEEEISKNLETKTPWQEELKGERGKITELDISKKGFGENLDLSDFINLKELNCSDNKLASLNLSNCSQLERVSCFNNQLTNLTLPTNPTNLKKLHLNNNNFPPQDLSFLTGVVNLERLYLGNDNQEKIKQGIYNKFTGSLDYLNGMKKLEYLDISNTDLNEVNIDKLPNSLEEIDYSTKKRPTCKLIPIVLQLEKYFGKYGRCQKCQQPNTKFEVEKDEQGQPKLLAQGGFINDINNNIVKCYGISQNPETKNYVMVMECMKGGNLRQQLQKKYLSLKDKLFKLQIIARGLNSIHSQGLVHRDFHSGNILNKSNKWASNIYVSYQNCFITDLGLCQPVNSQKQEREIFGVWPYVAPEVLQGQPYTQKADIYSFGIIAYELLAQAYPHPDLDGTELALQCAECGKILPGISFEKDGKHFCGTACQDKYTETKSQTEAKAQHFQTQLSQIKKTLTTLNHNITQTESSLQQKRTQLTQTPSDNNLQTEINQLQQQLTAYKSQKQKLETILPKLEQQINSLNSPSENNSEQEQIIQQLEQEIKEINQELGIDDKTDKPTPKKDDKPTKNPKSPKEKDNKSPNHKEDNPKPDPNNNKNPSPSPQPNPHNSPDNSQIQTFQTLHNQTQDLITELEKIEQELEENLTN